MKAKALLILIGGLMLFFLTGLVEYLFGFPDKVLLPISSAFSLLGMAVLNHYFNLEK